LVATAQLLLLDRVPDHAAIHNAVEWIKTTGERPRAAGFVNAVLRNITRFRGERISDGVVGNPRHFIRGDGLTWDLAEPVFEDDFATQVGFSQKSWKRLTEEFGKELAKRIATNSMVEPPIIVTSPQNCPLPESVMQHSIQGYGVVPQDIPLGTLFEEHPLLRVQDPTSGTSLSLANSLQPKRILDVCAGRGTKTKQLRSMFPDAMIGATEPNDARRASLLEIAEAFDFVVYSQDTDNPSEPFDLVVVDAPCSNSGVFARRPEAKYRYNNKHIDSVVELQQAILAEAVNVLQSRGHLLYATCSIDDTENEEQANWLITRHKLFNCDQIRTLPSGQPGDDPTMWHDGGYSILLQAT
jgi:16S rRNA (cytosine967-C5)-methyltransferase